jgi:hypothetical protein
MDGILLMCFNSKTYGKYAFNMAHSIRHYTDIPIHLISDHESTDGLDMAVFSSHDIVEFERNEQGKVDNCLAKIRLFERSPFERTLYLDVDGVMMKNPEELFEILEGENFYTQPMGSGKRGDSISYNWASNEVIWERFGFDDDTIFNTCQTSIIYFDKSEKSKELFEKLERAYDKKLKPIEYREMWGRSKQHPDELYYSIAMAQTGIAPKEFRPVFFPERKESETKIMEEYYVLSMYGGGNVKPYALAMYDRIMGSILRGKGINHWYKASQLYKKKFIRIK